MQRLEAGAAFGPYTIEGFIAGGGMGEVYAARHAVYGSPVALKVLHGALHADDSWRKRFNTEALVGQTLKHPHVLAARELVQDAGRVALIMDLARGGQTLARVMSREFATGLPLVQALQVFLGVLQGVEYAHAKEIVHGDIKPENVMLQGDFRDPSAWVPLVTDFGTVGLIADPVMIDGQAAVVASPRYASPEHLLGVDRIEVRSDIYSLGLLLHYLLTGRHASDARDVNEAATFTTRSIPLVYLVDQPESVIGLIQRATAVRPADRFATCREMALAIRASLDELGVKLELEDLQADLATEVMEERLDMKRELAEHQASDEMDTEIDVETDEGEAAEAAAPTPPGDDAEAPMAGKDETGEGREEAAAPHVDPNAVTPTPPPDRLGPGRAPTDDPDFADEPTHKNPLWSTMPDDEEEDPSEAPTARLSPTGRDVNDDATMAELEALAAAPKQAPATDPSANASNAPVPQVTTPPDTRPVPTWVGIAGAVALGVIALVMAYLYAG